MKPLSPPDTKQCQAEIKEGSFMTLGPRIYVRCKKPTEYVATEQRPQSDGRVGSMGLCASCVGELIAKLGPDYATFESVANFIRKTSKNTKS